MRTKARKISLFAALAAVLSLPMSAAAAPIWTVPGRYIIERKSTGSSTAQGTGKSAYTVTKKSRGFELVVPHRAIGRQSANGVHRELLNWGTVNTDCAEILKDSSVQSCEPDLVRMPSAIPNDPNFGSQWALRDVVNGADIGAPAAWNIGTGSSGTLIAVVDSGIYRQHPDLSPNLWTNPADPLDGVDNDGNGYVDDIIGMHTINNSGEFTDCSGHGTHVAGIIAASGNNGIGVSGVNWSSGLVVVNTDSDCEGSSSVSSIIEAFDYLTGLKLRGHNIRVVNASFGGPGASQQERSAIERLQAADILLVAAAGNDNENVDVNPSYPANYDLPNVLSVGATGPTLSRAYYSNFGQSVDIMAPGGDADFSGGTILSTYSPDASGGSLYRGLQGTSMATPMVTGAIGLLASQRTQLTGLQLKEVVLNSARRIAGLQQFAAGGRFLDLAAMVQADDPIDGCPSDPTKVVPGLCGCGVVEDSGDSDSDGTINCKDGCVDDPAKVSVGVCGCGISDIDSDADGNADCLGPSLDDIIPPRPKISFSKKRILIRMGQFDQVEYIIEVVVSTGRTGSTGKRSSKTSYYVAQGANAAIPRPKSGSEIKVSYAYRSLLSSSELSLFSRAVRFRRIQ